MWRTATAVDDRDIIEMCRELNQEDPGPRPVPEEHTQRTLTLLRSEPARGRAAVLDIDGQVEGYAFLISFWSNEMGGEVCNIDELYVRPGRRNQGFGSTLVENLVAGSPMWPRRPIAIELEVTPQNTRARALYSKLGFQPAKNALMRLRFGLLIGVALGLFILSTPLTFAMPPSIVGTWNLESFIRILPQGQEVSWCKGVHGLLSYTDQGYMSAAINCDKDTPPDSPSATNNNMLLYAGTYKVNTDKQEVVHHVLNSSALDLIGTDMPRHISKLTSDELVLDGKSQHGKFHIVWKRLK